MSKSPTIAFKTIFVTILAGILNNFTWLFEIVKIKGWDGLHWLDGYMGSVFLIIPVIVLSYMYSIRYHLGQSNTHTIVPFVGLSVIGLISFEIAREFLYLIYSGRLMFSYSRMEISIIIVTGLILPNLIFSVGFYLITHYFMIKIRRRTVVLYIIAIVLSTGLGYLTVHFNRGFGTGTAFIDSVKMGYPIFWLNLFLGILPMLINTQKADHEKIPVH
jgi:hypothetical protein